MSKTVLSAFVLPSFTYILAKRVEVSIDKNSLSVTKNGVEVFAGPLSKLKVGTSQYMPYTLLSNGHQTVRLLFSNPWRVQATMMGALLPILGLALVGFRLSTVALALLMVVFRGWFYGHEFSNSTLLTFYAYLRKHNVRYNQKLVDQAERRLYRYVNALFSLIPAALFAYITALILGSTSPGAFRVILVIAFIVWSAYFIPIGIHFDEVYYTKKPERSRIIRRFLLTFEILIALLIVPATLFTLADGLYLSSAFILSAGIGIIALLRYALR